VLPPRAGKEQAMQRHQIPLWFGKITISGKNLRRPEEQSGEVPTLNLGELSISWWSNEQLARRTERAEQRRAARDQAWEEATKRDREAGGR